MALMQRTQNTQASPVASGAALTADGSAAVNITTLINSIQGTNELVVTFTNSGAADRNNVLVFPGVWAQGSEATLPEDVSMTIDGFADRNTFLAYYAHIATGIAGVRFEVSGTGAVDNYSNYIFFTEKQPHGEEKTVKMQISRYREVLSTGYSETMEIPASDLSFVQWNGLRWGLNKIKAGTTIKMYLYVKGWNKSQGLNSLTASILA